MSEKRFTYGSIPCINSYDVIPCITDNEENKHYIKFTDTIVILNQLAEENEQLKSLLKDAEEEIETLKKSNQKLMESLVEHEAED